MPSNKHTAQNTSRREFLVKGSITSMGLLLAGSAGWANPLKNIFEGKPNSKIAGVQIGVITYSYRDMPGGVVEILKYVVDSGISAIELMGDAVETYAGKPENPVKFPPFVPGQQHPQLTDDQKKQLADYQKTLAAWRTSVSMDRFKEVKKMYNKAGVSIYAFKPNALNANNSDAEIEYALMAAKELGGHVRNG